jgi:hypothetical protein
MDASDIAWLRANRTQIRIRTTEDGWVCFEVEDAEVYDTLDDYVDEVLAGRFGEVWHRHRWDNPKATRTYQIGFPRRDLSAEYLREILEQI